MQRTHRKRRKFTDDSITAKKARTFAKRNAIKREDRFDVHSLIREAT